MNFQIAQAKLETRPPIPDVQRWRVEYINLLAGNNRTVAHPKPDSINGRSTLGRAQHELEVSGFAMGLIADDACTDHFSLRGSKHRFWITRSAGLKTVQLIKQFRSDQRNIKVGVKFNNRDKIIGSQVLAHNRLKLVCKGRY